MKHTPGPWTYRLSTGRTKKYYITSGNDCVVNVHGDLTAQDARLIAAAPELLKELEALEAFRMPTVQDWQNGAVRDEFARLKNKARAAIIKATNA